MKKVDSVQLMECGKQNRHAETCKMIDFYLKPVLAVQFLCLDVMVTGNVAR